MTEVDGIMQERLMPLYEKVFASMKEKHTYLSAILNSILAGDNRRVGMQITENGQVIGEYTFRLNGMKVTKLDIGLLDSSFATPFGVIKPYAVLDKATLIEIVEDEQGFIDDLFATKLKYAPDVTIKFLR